MEKLFNLSKKKYYGHLSLDVIHYVLFNSLNICWRSKYCHPSDCTWQFPPWRRRPFMIWTLSFYRRLLLLSVAPAIWNPLQYFNCIILCILCIFISSLFSSLRKKKVARYFFIQSNSPYPWSIIFDLFYKVFFLTLLIPVTMSLG